MSSKPRILCVDDEQDLLDGLRLSLRKRFKVTVATSGAEGLELFDEAAQSDDGAFAVVVSDMRMPGMDGARFLTAIMDRSPDTPRILLSGQADLDSTIAAINDARIYRFLTKPCDPETIIATLDEALELARLRESEQVLLGKTVRGAVTMLTEVLGLVSVTAYSRTTRVRGVVGQLCASLRIQTSWDLDVAALLSQIGSVVPEASDEGAAMSGQQSAEIAANLLQNIPRLEAAAAIVRTQSSPEPQLTVPLAQATRPALDAELLRLAIAFDVALGTCGSEAKAIEAVRAANPTTQPELLSALGSIEPAQDDLVEALIEAKDFVAGMELLDDLHTSGGAKLAGAGTVLTAVLIQRVHSFIKTVGLEDGPIAVLAPRSAVPRSKVR